MNNTTTTVANVSLEAREEELRQFIAWTNDNPGAWTAICNNDLTHRPTGEIYEMIE